MNASPPFVWHPTPEIRNRCNVGRFLTAHGLPDLTALIDRSIREPAWFWDAVVRSLPIAFFQPYSQVLDDSAGIPWPRWFVGGTLNVAHNCVDRHAEGPHRDATALIWEGEDGEVRCWTYDVLAEEVNRAANALLRLGVAPGDRVGLFTPMLLEAVAAFFACAKVGAVVIPIFSGFGAKAVADRLTDAGAKVLISADGFFRKGKAVEAGAVAAEALRASPSVEHHVVIRRLGNRPLARPGVDRDWAEWTEGQPIVCPSLPVDSEHPLMIAYTSGTTGKPKGAVHVHGGFLVKIAQEVAHQVDMTRHDTLYWVTDLGWIMGPWELVGGLCAGGTVLLYEGAPDYPSPHRLGSLLARHQVTILGISPTLIRAFMRYGEEVIQSHDLSNLRILGSTGEPWNPEPWDWYFRVVGGGRCPVINLSGGTEIGACLLSPFPLSPLKPCGLGGPALGMAVDVVDDHGAPLRGGVGELVCRRPWPSMTRGLWGDPERYLRTYFGRWPDLWVHGDWASIDDDGVWFLHGRSDDTLKVAGKRLGPAEVESLLVADPSVAEAAAIGVPHEIKGEAIWCFVVLKPPAVGDDRLVQALKDRVCDVLGKAFAPEAVHFVDELPKTRNAKILRRLIRARVLGLDPGDLSNLENPSALTALDRFRPGGSS